MRLGVQLLEPVRLNLIINVTRELRLVALLVVVGERLHVLSDVAREDVLAQGFGVELLGLVVVAWETLLRVWDVETTVGRTLHGAEHARAGGGPGKTHIEEALERAAGFALDLGLLGDLELSIGLLDTDEAVADFEFAERATGDEQTDAVGGGPVGQAVGDAVALELVGVGGDEDLVAGDLRGDDLGDDVLVGEADDEAVLGRIVLVLGLGDEALAGVVVGLTRPAALVLDLVAAETVSDAAVSEEGEGRGTHLK